MARELFITLYLIFFSLLYQLFKVIPLQNKVVFVVTFIDNSSNIYDEIRRQESSCRVIFLANKKVHPFYSKYDDSVVLRFDPRTILQFVISIYHLATAKVVVVDNYYAFLSTIKFKKGVTCLQIWHASGAIKQFGLKDPSNKYRSKRALNRFFKVYSQFNKIIVGSEIMSDIFKKAFGLNEKNILRTGIPRTDIYFNPNLNNIIRNQMYAKFPFLASKKIILYAPTYRDDEISGFNLNIDLDLMQKELSEDFIVLLRLHPAIKNKINIEAYENFVYDFSSYNKLNDILFVTDILITDYSSIPFDFSILERPMIFFPYDFAQYAETRGFWEDYKKNVPGPIVNSTEELIYVIKEGRFDYQQITSFREKWNEYSKGDSSKKVASWIINQLDNKTQPL